MVPSAERDSELVTDLATQGAGLGKSKMVRVRGLAAAHEARLLGDIAKVLPVAIAARGRHTEHALIDADLLNIRIASLLTTSAATFRTIDIHDLSAFRWQELG
jgi:hypothetical protein